MVYKFKYSRLKTMQSRLKTQRISSLGQKYIPQKQKKFVIHMKPKDQIDDVQFEMQNLTTRDSLTLGE